MTLGWTRPRSGERPGWERPEWLGEAVAWSSQVLETGGHVPDAAVVVKSWPCSAVIRMDTLAGKSFFFKAVHAKPPAEPAVLAMLSRRGVTAVPRPIAVDIERRWMVVPGHSDVRPSSTTQVLGDFANLQLEVSGDLRPWRDLGAPLLDARVLPERFAEALDLIDESADRARVLDDVAHHCDRLAVSPIGNAVVHQDLRDENIAADDGLLFFDWADIALAHPFFSAVRYLDFQGCNLVRSSAEIQTPLQEAVDAYLRPFAARYGEDRARRDFATVWLLQGVFMLVRWRRELDFVDPRSAWGQRLASFVGGEWHSRVLQRVGLRPH